MMVVGRALGLVTEEAAASGTLLLKDGTEVDAVAGAAPKPTVDPATGKTVGRFVGDEKGNVMIEPVGGKTVQGPDVSETHTLYPNGSNYQRLNPEGHASNPTPHGHGHLEGTGPFMRGQGASIDPSGNTVPWNSWAAHWTIHS